MASSTHLRFRIPEMPRYPTPHYCTQPHSNSKPTGSGEAPRADSEALFEGLLDTIPSAEQRLAELLNQFPFPAEVRLIWPEDEVTGRRLPLFGVARLRMKRSSCRDSSLATWRSVLKWRNDAKSNGSGLFPIVRSNRGISRPQRNLRV